MVTKPVQDEKPSEVARSKRATFDRLAKKTRAEREITISLEGDDGEMEDVTLLFRALGTKAYDDLIAKHPPLPQQKLNGDTYNISTFGPALIAKCAVEPTLSYDEAKSIWDSEEWSRGEVMNLFAVCVELNNKGLNIPFSVGG